MFPVTIMLQTSTIKTHILELHLQALLRCFRAFSFHIVDFLESLCQFLVHVVNKAVVSCFTSREKVFCEKYDYGIDFVNSASQLTQSLPEEISFHP